MRKMDLYDIKVVYYKIAYGNTWMHLYALDALLQCFKNTDYISNEQMYRTGKELPPNFDVVMNKLSDDGMININRYGIEITLNGKMKISKGGYCREMLRKRVCIIGSIIGVIASVVAIISYFG